MSKGNRLWLFRIPPKLEAAALEFLRTRNKGAFEGPWSKSDLMIAALKELLKHRARSGNARLRQLLIAAGVIEEEPAHG